MSSSKKKIIVVFGVALILIGIFFTLSFSNNNVNQSETSQPTTQTDALSVFLTQNKASADVAEAYRFAKENPQGVLSKIKCYCGCLEEEKDKKHDNNRECFFNKDESFDLMGLNCGLCIKTALTAKEMLSQGKTVQEISDYVDARWGK
ncbi:MAG: PCYCGC motif-containing (lipo)protein [Candidatus Daviesbacteria bacterium]|nr:PCYCGC motif-containing (lipo)protein [Candidatus Daviesbacteria bacterium]